MLEPPFHPADAGLVSKPSIELHARCTLWPMPRQRARDLPEGLFQRGRSWVYRRVIPPELRQRIGRREVHKVLPAEDEQEARLLASVEAIRAQRLFHEATEGLLLDSASADLASRHTDTLAALSRLLPRLTTTDPEAVALLSALLSRLARRGDAGVTTGEGLTITALLDLWNEAERPSLPEFHVVGVAVDRFVKALGDRRLADVTPTALQEFELVLATTPYQKSGQPLHRSGRQATVGAIERLVKWFHDGGPERAEHARSLGAASSERGEHSAKSLAHHVARPE
jgi:hypothetical protein